MIVHQLQQEVAHIIVAAAMMLEAIITEAVHPVAHTIIVHQPVAIHQVIIVAVHIVAVAAALVVAVHALAVVAALVVEVLAVAVLVLVAVAVEGKPFIP